MKEKINYFYIAEIGTKSEEILEKVTDQMYACGTKLKAIEVYDTPFDAVRALNKIVKLMPEHHVTIYRSDRICNIVKISNNSESKILALTDIKFKKYQVMALGSLVYSL